MGFGARQAGAAGSFDDERDGVIVRQRASGDHFGEPTGSPIGAIIAFTLVRCAVRRMPLSLARSRSWDSCAMGMGRKMSASG